MVLRNNSAVVVTILAEVSKSKTECLRIGINPNFAIFWSLTDVLIILESRVLNTFCYVI